MNDMNREEYISHLSRGVCTVTFTKVNGDTRVMRCTLDPNFIPTIQAPVDIIERELERKENGDSSSVIKVFDLEAISWRSFRVDSVTDFQIGG